MYYNHNNITLYSVSIVILDTQWFIIQYIIYYIAYTYRYVQSCDILIYEKLPLMQIKYSERICIRYPTRCMGVTGLPLEY